MLRSIIARVMAVSLALSPLIGLSSCAPADGASSQAPSEHWRFAIEEVQGSVQHAYALKFKELIEQRSGGEIEVTVFPLGTLGSSDQLTELCHMGTLEFVTASPGHLGKVIPEVQVFLLHFLFSENQRANNIALNENPALQKTFRRLYGEKGFELLSIFSEGWQVWTTNKPIREPADFRGVKFRVMNSPLLLAAYEAYGASPTPIDYADVYSALQLNMIDGQENPVFAIEEMSFYEVTEWMIFPDHAPFITTVMANREFYDGLSPKRQKMVDEVVAELNRFILKKQQDYNTQRLQTILENKPEMNLIADLSPDRRKALLAANPDLNLHPGLTDDERAAFRRASLPVREQYIEMVGQEGQRLLSRLKRAVAAAEKRLQESPSRTDPEQEADPRSAVQQNGDSAAESSDRL